MVTSPSTSGPPVPRNDLTGSAETHVSRGKTHPPKPFPYLHPCLLLWWENNFSQSAPATRMDPRPRRISSLSRPLTTDVDGATAESCTCNRIRALDAIGHDAEKNYAVQKGTE